MAEQQQAQERVDYLEGQLAKQQDELQQRHKSVLRAKGQTSELFEEIQELHFKQTAQQQAVVAQEQADAQLVHEVEEVQRWRTATERAEQGAFAAAVEMREMRDQLVEMQASQAVKAAPELDEIASMEPMMVDKQQLVEEPDTIEDVLRNQQSRRSSARSKASHASDGSSVMDLTGFRNGQREGRSQRMSTLCPNMQGVSFLEFYDDVDDDCDSEPAPSKSKWAFSNLNLWGQRTASDVTAADEPVVLDLSAERPRSKKRS